MFAYCCPVLFVKDPRDFEREAPGVIVPIQKQDTEKRILRGATVFVRKKGQENCDVLFKLHSVACELQV